MSYTHWGGPQSLGLVISHLEFEGHVQCTSNMKDGGGDSLFILRIIKFQFMRI